MASKASTSRSLTGDQVTLLVRVISRSQLSLSSTEWEEIAKEMGISNGKAAKERFRYMMAQLKDGKMTSGTSATPNPPNKVVKRSSIQKKTQAINGQKKNRVAKKHAPPVKKESEEEASEEGEEEGNGLTPEEYKWLRKDIQAHDVDGIFADMEKDAAEEYGEEFD